MNASIFSQIRNHGWLLTIVLLGALVLPSIGIVASPALSSVVAAAPPSAPVPTSAAVVALQATTEQIYEQVSPSVVSIQVIQKATTSPLDLPDPFGFFGPQGQPQQPPERYGSGLGSGFVWDSEGHVVTNNHVVDGADKISVVFSDGTTLAGKVIGRDPDSDLAVVQVDASAGLLKPVEVADSTQLKVGQLAVAIGNPFGLQGTMTVGFISSLGRLLPVESDTPGTAGYSIPDIIQTDAPINPGNSGGVLVDDQGQVIGVTSAIISPVRASASIGFAIPSVIVQKVVPLLISHGKVEHPWLGISGSSLNPDLARGMGLNPDQRGALVVDVTNGGPADKAGIRGSSREITVDGQPLRVGGDVITAINGQEVKSFDDVVTYLARFGQIDQAITLSLVRDGLQQEISVTLAARPKSGEEQPASAQSTGGAWLGIAGQTLTPDIAAAMNLPADQQGVLVGQVVANGPADEAGLRGSYKPAIVNGEQVLVGGDIITAFNGQAVTSMEDLQSYLRAAAVGDEATITVWREGQSATLTVSLGERPVQ